MGKGWKTAGKIANSQKKGQLFTKLAREIQIAAKLGGADPEANSRLRMAIDEARTHSCPNETIERAIKKGAGLLDDGKIIEEISYEGFGPHGVGIIVECQTDNKHRTAPEIRNVFKSHGGNMGETGSVTWMFKRIGYIEAQKPGPYDLEEEAIESGADDVETHDSKAIFMTKPEHLDEIKNNLMSRKWEVVSMGLAFRANNKTEVSEDQRREVEEFLEALDDLDDTHQIFATI